MLRYHKTLIEQGAWQPTQLDTAHCTVKTSHKVQRYANGYKAERHLCVVEVAKNQYHNLDEHNMHFIEEFYPSCNSGCFWWIFFNGRPTCYTYQSLSMTIRKICVKQEWAKESPFKSSHLTVCFMTLGQKEGGIYLSPLNHDR